MADTSGAATPAGADHDHEVMRLFESCSVRDFRRSQLPCSELLAQSREESADLYESCGIWRGLS
jgi:hypothetical protein